MRTTLPRTKLPLSLLFAVAVTALAAGCSRDGSEEAVQSLEEGGDVAKIKALVKENVATHVEAASKVARKLGPLFDGSEAPGEEALREALAGLTKPPEVIQALVFSPVDLTVVVDPEGQVLARDREAEGRRFVGRNLFEESPALAAAFAEGKATHAVGVLGRGDKAVPYLYFIAPIERDGEPVAAAVLGYGLWKEGRRITLQMRRETEQGDEPVLVIWAFSYLGDTYYKLPNSPLEVEKVVPSAEARRAGLAKSPEGFVTADRILRREVAIAVIPFPEVGDDFGIIYLR